MLCFCDCVDLREYNGGACVEGVAYGGVLVAGDADPGDCFAFTHEYYFVDHLIGRGGFVSLREGDVEVARQRDEEGEERGKRADDARLSWFRHCRMSAPSRSRRRRSRGGR